MTSSNTFQSDIGSLQNGGHGEEIIKARLELFMYYLSISRLGAFFIFIFIFIFFNLPTDPLSRERGRWENKTFYGDGLTFANKLLAREYISPEIVFEVRLFLTISIIA